MGIVSRWRVSVSTADANPVGLDSAETEPAAMLTPPPTRGRGRPRREIERERAADVIERIFETEGYEAISVVRVAQELGVSRATLYRTVPTKEHLLGVLHERMMKEALRDALRIMDDQARAPRDRLADLVRVQVAISVRQQKYLFVFFGPGWLPEEDFQRWRTWRKDYEDIWLRAVTDAMAAGDLPEDDPVVATRLLIGMTLWVARWYRESEGRNPEDIAESALRLVLPQAHR
jgi:AcrR family transcriptional regulator